MRCSSNCVWICWWEFELECGVRLRVWNTGRRCKVLAACKRDGTAVADDGPASPGNCNHGPALGVVMMLSGVKRRCYSFRDCHRQSYSFCCQRPNYSSWYGLAVRLDEWWCAWSTMHGGRAVGRWSLSWCCRLSWMVLVVESSLDVDVEVLYPSQAKVLTGGGDLGEGQVDVPLSVSHSCVWPHCWAQ